MLPVSSPITVVVPCYNLAAYLQEAVHSALASTLAPHEVVVVDDGSTPPVDSELLHRLAAQAGWEGRVRLLRQENQGVASARNRGIGEAQTPYVLPLDADDRICPSYLEKACAVLEAEKDVGVVYPHLQRFGAASDVWQFRPFTLPELLAENRVPVCAVFRTEVWRQCGGYDERLETHEDWEFWIRVAACGWRFHLIPEPLAEYRARPDSKVRRWDQPEVRRRLIQYILEKHQNLYRAHALAVLTLKELEILRLERLYRECGDQLAKTAEGVRIQEVVIKQLLAEAEQRSAELARLRVSPWRRWWRTKASSSSR